MTEISSVSVIGLGSMGWGSAMSLIEAGYSVFGVDIKQDILERFGENRGTPCNTAAEAAVQSEAVLLYVVSDSQAEEALFGEFGAVSAAKPGTLFIINSTLASNVVIRLAEALEAKGMRAVDAPVTGGAERALRGELTIMVSGDQQAVESASPVLDTIGGRVIEVGDRVGLASQIKMINQLLSGIHIAATAEAMIFAAKIGVDLNTLYNIVSDSTGSSWMFENRGRQIVSGDYKLRSSVDIILKDLDIAVEDAAAHDLDLRLAQEVRSMFSQAHESGLGEKDGATIAKLLATLSDTKMPGT